MTLIPRLPGTTVRPGDEPIVEEGKIGPVRRWTLEEIGPLSDTVLEGTIDDSGVPYDPGPGVPPEWRPLPGETARAHQERVWKLREPPAGS
jgi:hypothetical protein